MSSDSISSGEQGSMKIEGFPPSVVVNGPTRCEVSDPHAKSASTVQPDGKIRVTVVGKPTGGTAAEHGAFEVLRTAMSKLLGKTVLYTPPTNEQNLSGHDGFFAIDGSKPVTVQLVSVPVDSAYAATLAKGESNEVTLTVEEAARWIRDAIVKKSARYEPAFKAGTVLALDLRHAAPSMDQPVLGALANAYPEAFDHGFADVWLVGPIADRCKCLRHP